MDELGYIAAYPACTSCSTRRNVRVHMREYRQPSPMIPGDTGMWTCLVCGASMSGDMALKVRDAWRLAQSEYVTVREAA